MGWNGWSLRRKLVFACVAVQLLAAALLVLAGSRLLQRTLLAQARFQTERVVALLQVAVEPQLATRDYATLQQTLDLLRREGSIDYLVMVDHLGKPVAATGWDPKRPLPPRDQGDFDLDRDDTTYHVGAPLMVAGQPLGVIDLGLSTARLREVRADFLLRSAIVGSLALLASMALLVAIALAITRHLARLSDASQRVAGGDFDVHVPVTTRDEIGRLGASFNAMAAALKERMQALARSEARQQRHLREMREEQSRLTTLLSAMPGGILFVDPQARVIYANASFAALWSLPAFSGGQPLAGIVPLLAERLQPADAVHVQAMLGDPARHDGHHAAQPRELRMLDGRLIVQRMQPIAQGAHGGGSIWFYDDVTTERLTQQRAHQALLDPLTGLLNRRGLYEELESTIAAAKANGEHVSLLFIDLDDFKYANDVGGHRLGDEILVSVARALAGQLRKGERVARLGGDEFAVLCPQMEGASASAVAARLVEAVSALRFESGEQALGVGCSVGLAAFPTDAASADELVACADAAMYEAKRAGKNTWAAFHRELERKSSDNARANWNARIHAALREQRFVLHFQPVHRAADLRISHFEALVRMVDEHEPSVLIPPSEFIPHAERSGAVRQIDRWVLEACAAHLAAAEPGVSIAANLSACTLDDRSLPGFLSSLLQRHDVDPRRLHIELTETAAISDPAAARQLIDKLRALGCSVHLDDFGSGFSGFSHIKLMGVDAIKIDGSFVRNLHADSTSRLFVAAMIEIAHDLRRVVVAEHVEDAATLDLLRSMGIDLVQGFHLGRPSERLEARTRPQLHVVSDFRRSTTRGDTG
ncbi:MAG: EAL domain-containing protein [Proteobacteria bacterium]|nr:EAL domain-containing protein [Pseudomonadota bacterium]